MPVKKGSEFEIRNYVSIFVLFIKKTSIKKELISTNKFEYERIDNNCFFNKYARARWPCLLLNGFMK